MNDEALNSDEEQPPAGEAAEPNGDDAPTESHSDESGAPVSESHVAEAEHAADAPADESASNGQMAEAASETPPPPPKKRSRGAAESQLKAEGPNPESTEQMDWYILKVQSNRENSIIEALQRRVAMAGMDSFFGQIIVPVENRTEFKGGKKRVVRSKLYPGYIVVQMIINDDTWFLVRETPGIGDFTGSGGKPTPMLAHEVHKIVLKQEEKDEEAPKLKINFRPGDRVKITDGTFDNFEGEVNTIDEASGRVTVMINIFGRSTPVELEYWQVEPI